MGAILAHHGLLLAGAGGATDPYWANVVALLHFDGTNGSTTFTDSKGLHTWTAAGSAVLFTSEKKFGTASGDFRASGGTYITTTSHADFGFGTGDFTIEGQNFYSPGTSGVFQCMFDNRSASNEGIGIYNGDSSSHPYLDAYNASSIIASSSTSGNFGFGVWDHWAVTRASNTLRGFINGTQVFSITDSRTYASSAQPYIGNSYALSQPSRSLLDEIRITKGVARYTANFSPPTAPFPNS